MKNLHCKCGKLFDYVFISLDSIGWYEHIFKCESCKIKLSHPIDSEVFLISNDGKVLDFVIYYEKFLSLMEEDSIGKILDNLEFL